MLISFKHNYTLLSTSINSYSINNKHTKTAQRNYACTYVHARTHTHIFRHTQNWVTQGVSGTEHLRTSAKEEKGTDNEETNLGTLGIYAVPRAYIYIYIYIYMHYVPRGPRDLNNIVRTSKYMVRRKDGLMYINITLCAHERTIPHPSVFSSQQLNSTSIQLFWYVTPCWLAKPIAAKSSSVKQSLDCCLLNPIQYFQMFAGTNQHDAIYQKAWILSWKTGRRSNLQRNASN